MLMINLRLLACILCMDTSHDKDTHLSMSVNEFILFYLYKVQKSVHFDEVSVELRLVKIIKEI